MKLFLGLVAVVAMLVIGSGVGYKYSASTAQEQTLDDQFLPIDNMHHFMEYISQPSYKALKQALASEPENRRAWRPVKVNTLILAETSALVAARVPEDLNEEQAKQWKQISLDVYNAGKELYGSMGQYDNAKQHYAAMIDNCNRCHQVFADGEHQLEK